MYESQDQILEIATCPGCAYTIGVLQSCQILCGSHFLAENKSLVIVWENLILIYKHQISNS